MSQPRDHERYEILLVKVVDGLATDDEQRALDDHLATCQECREELADFTAIKETTDAMTQRILQDARLEPPREEGTRRIFLGLCFALIIGGLLLLAGFGGFQIFTDPTVPMLIRLGLGAAGIGALGLLAYLLKNRLLARGGDPYEEIDQ